MRLLVSSAADVGGEGYGTLMAFDEAGRSLGAFSNDTRICDPRGLAVSQDGELLFVNSGSDRVLALDRHGKVVRDSGPIPQLNPGGANFGPDGRYYLTLRSARTIMALPAALDNAGEYVLPSEIVPFPRGFAFDGDRTLFLSSGIGPDGKGDNTILALVPGRDPKPRRLVCDPRLSPLDLTIGPNGNIIVSSEWPFGSMQAETSIREYAAGDGRLVRVLSAKGSAEFRRPRGLRFGTDGTLYCVARDEVVAFNYASGRCLGALVRYPGINGQAVVPFPN